VSGQTYTPGPWRLEIIEDRSIKHLCPIDADDISILTVVMQDEMPFACVYNDADARLIVAAPDLLDAMMALMDDNAPLDSMYWNNCCDKAREAIAKTTGEKSGKV
jgi:hypothetical protein